MVITSLQTADGLLTRSKCSISSVETGRKGEAFRIDRSLISLTCGIRTTLSVGVALLAAFLTASLEEEKRRKRDKKWEGKWKVGGY